MEHLITSRLKTVQFGQLQTYKNMGVLPLIAQGDGRFKYCTMGEALTAGDLAITEVSAAGSVPELLVINRGNQPVLLLDGEELAGAKQNRVLNTSILLKGKSETRIPVSCTEQGRWSYDSREFHESGNVMAYKSRSRKTRSVHEQLESSGIHNSDQGQVWHEIHQMHLKAGTHSPTSAMSDVYKAKEDDLRKCEEIFRRVDGQVGVLAIIDGRLAGMDLVSLPSAYSKLHPKLIRSYTLEGLLASRDESRAPEGVDDKAHRFFEEIEAAEVGQFASVGYGADHRFKGKTLAGTALIHEDEVIHAAFFRLDGNDRPAGMAPFSSRRRFSQ